MTIAAAPESSLVTEATAAAGKDLATVKAFPRGGTAGLVPTTIEQASMLAQLLARSEMLPKGYHQKPADVLVAILFGSDLGLPPMQAIQSVACINGKPSLYGDGFLAVIYNHPEFRDHDEYFLVQGKRVEVEQLRPDDLKDDTTTAVSTFWRDGRQKPRSGSFSVGQAKAAQLWGKSGPWTQYTSRMLVFRARGFGGRDMFPDALRGMLSAEEAGDIPIEAELVPAPALRMPERASDVVATVAATETVKAAATPATADPAAIPDGCDRIVAIDRVLEKHQGYWIATTASGKKIWGTHKNVPVDTVASSGPETLGSVVRLTFGDKPWGEAVQVTKIEVVKG